MHRYSKGINFIFEIIEIKLQEFEHEKNYFTQSKSKFT